jgi:hypothetical protein
MRNFKKEKVHKQGSPPITVYMPSPDKYFREILNLGQRPKTGFFRTKCLLCNNPKNTFCLWLPSGDFGCEACGIFSGGVAKFHAKLNNCDPIDSIRELAIVPDGVERNFS